LVEWERAERLFPTYHPSGKAYAVKEKGTEGKILLKIKKHLQIENTIHR
jgi:uracil-DNA glycosylase